MKEELIRHAIVLAWIAWVLSFSLVNILCMMTFNETRPFLIAIPVTLISLLVFALTYPIQHVDY